MSHRVALLPSTTLPAVHTRQWRPGSGQTRPGPASHRGGRVWPLLALLTALTLAGCTPRTSSPKAPTPTTPSTAPAATTPPNPAIAALDDAIAAYRGMWAAYETASATADPDEPSLSKYATGDALALLRDGLRQMRADHQVARGAMTLQPMVVGISPAAAPTHIAISDCANTIASVLYHRDGGPVDNLPGGWRRITATVIATDGGWKVDSFGVLAVGSCDGS